MLGLLSITLFFLASYGMATGSRFWGQITVSSLPTWSGGGGAELNPTDDLSQGGLKGVAYALAARFCYVVRGVLSKVLVRRKAGRKRISTSTGTDTIANSSKHNASPVKKEKKRGKSKNKSATAPITAGVTGVALAMGQGGGGSNGGYNDGDCDHHPTANGMDSCTASANGDDADANADGRHPSTLTWRRGQWKWLRQERINQVWYCNMVRYNYIV
jgi:hypothetical protein